MKKNCKKILSITFMFMLLFVSVFNCDKASAATTLGSYNFSGTISAWGNKRSWYDYYNIASANYLKVDVVTSGGDTFDLRFVAIDDYPSSYKTLAQKKNISAKGNSYTFYFIPPNGSCPSSNSNNCITVPATYSNGSGVYLSTNSNVAEQPLVMYGIEIYNGSILGGNLSVSGTYTFMNY